MVKKKSNEEFMNSAIENSIKVGNDLSKIDPQISDDYDSHSLLKLISISYWTGIFVPIANVQKQKYGTRVVYIDAMAGSGVTKTKDGEFFCGSCPSAMVASQTKGKLFDDIYFNEQNSLKYNSLYKRLDFLKKGETIHPFNSDIEKVSGIIGDENQRKSLSYVVYDPQALQGVTWKSIEPLACLRGDFMLSWFEWEAWRLREAALTNRDHNAKQGDINRLNELFGHDKWVDAQKPEDLTKVLVDRILQCKNGHYEIVKIPRDKSNYFLMILFTGNFQNAEKLSKEWKYNLERRLKYTLTDIKKMISVNVGKQDTLY